ncbi:cyclase family protein [Desulfoluna spongiiphila]|uniref:Kynurenine formamidase n=1 Tax=Desulfoluna spongiiphila TaxID=419481 RepID=A0A1G5JMN4_9BACT|nr:cyclase family protein [Desulfoluna spongiiphila]SCY88968.1 Kynurenine formamidase [Desulfoluna spongiiphila]
MEILDLSAPLDTDTAWAPWWARTRVKRQGHRFGALSVFLLTRLTPRFLRRRLGWANDTLTLSSHGTTHLDAPWHYAPDAGGKRAMTIDEIPLSWCVAPGVCLDMSHKKDGEAITEADITAWEEAQGIPITAGTIVLIRTGMDRLLGNPAYFTSGPWVTREATALLTGRGVKVTGIDAWGWDGPLSHMARRARSGQGEFWESHYQGADTPYCHLERLAGLHRLPAEGFTVCCFPLKVKGGSAGPTRAVALMPAEGEGALP